MRHSLHSHILFLENRLQFLRDQLTRPGMVPQEIEEIQRQINSAELALAHYRAAYVHEIDAAGSGPPTASDGESSESAGNSVSSERSRRRKKREGLTVTAPSAQRKYRVRFLKEAAVLLSQRERAISLS